MACPINVAETEKLKFFIQLCSTCPQILNDPGLKFFKDFIEQMGGRIPEASESEASEPQAQAKPETAAPPKADIPKQEQADASPDSSETEPEPDIDREGCVEADSETAHEMGDLQKEPTEEDIELANDLRSKAQAAYSEQKYDEAIDLYTQAILLNPKALFFAKRGQCFLKSQKPNACIRDCDRALEINCDSAAAYKFRGRARRLLGHWEESVKDLRQACKLDYDEEADEWLREVTPRAHKLEKYRLDKERRHQEKELQARIKRNQEARDAHRKAQEEEKQRKEDSPTEGMDDDMKSMFADAEMRNAFMEILTDPSKIAKYAGNPKFKKIFDQLSAMGGGGMGGMPGGMGGMGGMPGGMGGMGGMPGGMGGMPGGMGGMPFGFPPGGAAPGADAPPPYEEEPPTAPPTNPKPKASNLTDDLD